MVSILAPRRVLLVRLWSHQDVTDLGDAYRRLNKTPAAEWSGKTHLFVRARDTVKYRVIFLPF